jgi:GDSL-like Lipase/Acylhydrolase family
LLRLSSVVPLT